MNITPTETKTSIETSLAQVNIKRGSISHALAVLRQKQGRIIISTVLFAALSTLLAIIVYLSAPSIERSLLWFSPVFDGCDKGLYPNGSKFSSNDLLAPHILERVYSERSVEKFMDRSQFLNAVSVLRSAEGLMSLDDRYAGLFEATSVPMSAVRQQQYQEYLDTKSKILSQAAYCVCLSATYLKKVPKTVRAEILLGILEEWSRFTKEERFVLKYPLFTINETLLDEISLKNDEPIIRLLKLRSITRGIDGSVDGLANYRGATDVNSASGTNLTSLRTVINNLIRNRIPLLAGTIRKGRLYKNFMVSSLYVRSNLFDLGLDEELQKGRVARAKKVQEAYLDNIAQPGSNSLSPPKMDSAPFSSVLIPQIGENFLDRVIALSQESQDTEYRLGLSDRIIEEGMKLLEIQQDIAFYQNLLPIEIVEGTTPPDSIQEQKRHSDIFESRFQDVVNDLRIVNRELIILHDLLSERQLKTNPQLYRTLLDVEHQSLFGMSPLKAVFILFFSVLMFFCFSCFGVLGLEYFR